MEIKATVTKVENLQTGTSRRTGNPWKCKEFVVVFVEGKNEQGNDVTGNLSLKTFKDEEIKELEVGRNCTISVRHDIRDYNGRTYNEVSLEKIVFEPKAF